MKTEMLRTSKCKSCKHNLTGMTCSAFPRGIPRDVYFELIPHYKQMENQIGDYIFEAEEEYEKYEKEYLEWIKELTSKRDEIEQDVILIATELIKKLNFNGNRKYNRFEIRLYRGASRMVRKVDEVLLFEANEKPKLISIGYNSTLFSKLRSILLLESIENHKTDLEFVIDQFGEFKMIFANYTLKERGLKNEIISKLLDERAKNILVSKGLRIISSEKLEEEIKLIVNETDIVELPKNRHILKILQEKGYAVLHHEVYKTRKKIGY